MKTLLVIASLIGFSVYPSQVDAARQQQTVPTGTCDSLLNYGEPTVPGKIQKICHDAYVSFVDINLKIPRLVIYHETGDQTFGCLPRKASFHADNQVPPEGRAIPADYANSGYDLGHFAPDQDMAYDPGRLADSYSTANVGPQKPKMNREGWESLEESVRSWAYQRGEVVVEVGSIVDQNPETIGHGIAVMKANFKIVIDVKTNETIGFIMNNVDTPKGDPTKFITTIAKIEEQSGITLPIPPGTDKNKTVALWHTSTSDWHKRHKELCKGK